MILPSKDCFKGKLLKIYLYKYYIIFVEHEKTHPYRR
jgi:hypothetical protein